MCLRRLADRLLAAYAGSAPLRLPATVGVPAAPRHCIVLSPGAIPTTDIYFRARTGAGIAAIVDTLASDPPPDATDADAVYVIVRYLPARWRGWLARAGVAPARIAYFLDDDMPCALAAAELPLAYAMRTAWRAARMARWLRGRHAALWVSTGELQRRYAGAGARVCAPVYLPSAATAAPALEPVYFYHGSGAHRRELEWLVPVVRAVQERLPVARFEVFGDARVERLFRGIARVSVLRPLRWPDYLARAGHLRYAVGLAPLLDGPFNRARAHVKLFDITRLGAAGVYSPQPAYIDSVRDGVTGLLCDNDPQAWADAIVRLFEEPARRVRIHAAAVAWCRDTPALPLPGAGRGP